MATITLIVQDVLPVPSGNGKINIVNNSTTSLTFVGTDDYVNNPLSADYVSFDGGNTLYSFEYLGNGDIGGDPTLNTSFIKVDMGDGTFQAFAIDMDAEPGEMPNLPNGSTSLTLADLDTSTPILYPGIACFTRGAMIETISGELPIETLEAGDLVRTADNGYQPLLHIARRKVPAYDNFAPIRFAPGALGNEREFMVSPQHRMLIGGWQAQLYCGEDEVFVPAKHLVNGRDIHVVEGGHVEYFHLLFADHEVIYGDGVPSESFYPGSDLSAEAQDARNEAIALFPELAHLQETECTTARTVVRKTEAVLLMAA